MLRIQLLLIFSENGGNYMVCLVFIHDSQISFQNKVRMRVNLPRF